MASRGDIGGVVDRMTVEQRLLFEHNLELWGKTVELNGRPKHFDSFDVDLHTLMQKWHHFCENVSSMDFDPNLAPTGKAVIPSVSAEDKSGFIYALKSEGLGKDLVKIGKTKGAPLKRAEDLSRPTGVPTPFEVALFCNVTDRHSAENWLKEALAAYRVSTKKEFYKVPEQILRNKFSEIEAKWGAVQELFLRLPAWIVKRVEADYSIPHLEGIIEDMFIERFKWTPDDEDITSG